MNKGLEFTFRVDSDDHEIQVIEVLMSVLSGLDNAQRDRVLDYVMDRFVGEAQ